MSEQQHHPIEGLMDTTLEKIKQLIDVDTIVGSPITTQDGTTIVPVSKVSYGFASGGSDIPSKNAINKQVFGGGSGAGVSITPIAFIVVNQGDAKILRVDGDSNNTADKIAQAVPQVVDSITGLFKKDKKKSDSDIVVDIQE
ncbi:MAG: GerW family sporulation protein [Acutalibacteraceae bacterium]